MTQHRLELQSAYVLHQRPYRNTSLLLDLFTQAHGLIGAVANNARGFNSRFRGQLQLFSPLLVSWSGKTELVSLTNLELFGIPMMLSGKALLCGFYLNELLIRLLPRYDAFPKVYLLYEQTLRQLLITDNLEMPLRLFEKCLLDRLGYGLSLRADAQSDEPIEPDALYRYLPDQGFVRTTENDCTALICHGRTLIALDKNELRHPLVLKQAKNLLRAALKQRLGAKPLASRLLF